MKHLAVSLLL